MSYRYQVALTSAFIIGFIVLKWIMLSTRFGDGNAYIYMAKVFLEGQLPYRDFIHVDPPGLLYYLSALRIFSGDNLWLYQLSIYLLDGLTAWLLFRIAHHYKLSFAYLAAPIYLISFTVISVSDFLTGLQPILSLMTLAVYMSLLNRPLLAGISWGFALLIKLYVIPPMAGVVVWLLWQRQYLPVIKLLIAAAVTFTLGMLPFIFISFNQIIDSLLLHQFNRPSGTDKMGVFGYFFKHEWLLISLAVLGGIYNRKLLFVLPLLFTSLFYLIFRDIYFMYLGNLMPWLVILSLFGLEKIMTLKDSRAYTLILLVLVYGLVIIYSLGDYSQTTARVGRFTNSQEISQYLQNLPQHPLYGSYEVVPVLALQTKMPILENYINSNMQNFSSGVMDKEFISQRVVETSAYLIGRISDYPELGVTDYGYEGYFSTDTFKQHCHRLMDFPSTSNELDNKIVIYQCQK